MDRVRRTPRAGARRLMLVPWDSAVRQLLILASLLLPVQTAQTREPDYEAMIGLRPSIGFQAALRVANDRLKANAMDGDAAGVRALVYANAIDYLALSPADARREKDAAFAVAKLLAPANPWTRAAGGLILQTADSGNAETELRKCLEENPGFLECHNLLGDLLRKTGRAGEAHAVYDRALKPWPADGELLVSQAMCVQEMGHAERALEILERLTRDQPGFARGHWHLAVMLYETGGSRALAMREAEKALQLDPLIWNGTKLLEALRPAPDA